MINRIHSIIWACLLAGLSSTAQSPSSLLWEISGNGLQKPSYLFGTMHVSNKMVFNLNDSFYQALSRVETVCLEVNPDTWQEDMNDMESKKARILDYSSMAGNDFLYESSLRLKDFTPDLKAALQKQPSSINLLLYRTQKLRDDFEEDTFLDMFIYQTGRRLGKKSAGLENYERAEKMMLEAMAAMGKETHPATAYSDALPANELLEKLEDAYRQGNLDMIDSLDKAMYRSEAFREIFIVRRNEIQARAIDSLLKSTSLFAGIGAAHLPGGQGVINLLREKGYRLKPVMVSGQSVIQKSVFENIIVPGNWAARFSEDGLISVDMPGPWYRAQGGPSWQGQWQYADMANGTYYSLTRIKTYAAFRHMTEKDVRRKADSLLYENVPGKMLNKSYVNNRSYPGIDILSRNRRGDIQRLQLYCTPFEVILLKVSGPAGFMESQEPERFFSSIQFHADHRSMDTGYPKDDLQASMPGVFHSGFNASLLPARQEYLSYDSTNGHAYLLFRSDVHQFGILGEDSIDLRLMEASFIEPETSGKVMARQWASLKGYPCLHVRELMGDSSIRETSFVIKGPHYFVWSVRHPFAEKDHGSGPEVLFFLDPVSNPQTTSVEDTSLQFRAITNPQPPIDEQLRRLSSEVSELPLNLFQSANAVRYWPSLRTAVFRDHASGDLAMLQWQAFPMYYHIPDTAAFWRDEMQSRSKDGDLVLAGPATGFWRNGQPGLQFELRDTGSSRCMHHQLLLDGKGLLSLSFIWDTLSKPGPLLSSLANSFTTISGGTWKDRLESRLPVFFNDLLSTDSLCTEKALQAIRELDFRPEDVPQISGALARLDPKGRNYDLLKSRLIAELGDIRENRGSRVVAALDKINEQVSDTVIFQQEVVRALARQKTWSSYKLLSRIMVQDPPVFENEYEYKNLFFNLHDSLRLSANLFPAILPLYSSEGFKPALISLLADLVDSGYVGTAAYANYFDAILFDARVELKKLRALDEKALFDASKRSKDQQPARVINSGEEHPVLLYARLLLPFYTEKAVVRNLFARLLQTRNESLLVNLIGMLAMRKIPVADSLLLHLAANDRYRVGLWKKLDLVKWTHVFPQAYRTQELMARSALISENDYDRMDSTVMLSQRIAVISGRPGRAFFFKYRVQKSEQWKLGMVGFLPLDPQKIEGWAPVVSLTDTRINDREPVADQLEGPFRKWLLGSYPSGKKFYQEIFSYQFLRAGLHDMDE